MCDAAVTIVTAVPVFLSFSVELLEEGGTDLHVCLLPRAGLPTGHHCLRAQRLQDLFAAVFPSGSVHLPCMSPRPG